MDVSPQTTETALSKLDITWLKGMPIAGNRKKGLKKAFAPAKTKLFSWCDD
jgi:hypothetical protein